MSNERGFTLAELLVATTLSLLILSSTALTFKGALELNDAATLTADSSQNLRAGTNLMVRDLLQAGRLIPIGGIPTPSGPGTTPVNRPSPPGVAYTFDPALDVIQAVTPGPGLGPVVNGQATDMITVLMVDTRLDLSQVFSTIAADGASMTVPASVPITNPATAIRPGDLILFEGTGNVLQQVTSVSGQTVFFAAGDDFNLNQRGATAGCIMQLQTNGAFPPNTITAMRVLMLTYYIDPFTTPGSPRLVRVVNRSTPRALAGVVEDLMVTYDLVDGVTNPTNLPQPVAPNTPAQIRKVNLHVGVRSDAQSTRTHEYIRNHVGTQISLRSLAFVPRYQ